MSDESQFIPGIYGYCDRWCERAFTARCEHFADEKDYRERSGIQLDQEHAAFLKSFKTMFGLAWISTEEKSFELTDEPLSESDGEKLEARHARIAERSRCDPLVRLPRDYGLEVHHWLQTRKEHFSSLPSRAGGSIQTSEALDVIAWHQFQIAMKLSRAVRRRLEAEEEMAEEKKLLGRGTRVGSQRERRRFRYGRGLPARRRRLGQSGSTGNRALAQRPGPYCTMAAPRSTREQS